MIAELQTRYGTMFVPDTDTGQYWWLKNTGASPEDRYIEEVCSLLADRPKGAAVDVGSNFGCWTLPLSRVAHAVYAIDAQACCVELLRRSLTASRIGNVTSINTAVDDVPGKMALVPQLDLERGENFGGLSLFDLDRPELKAEVPTVTLDVLLKDEQVSFIKIDVEGWEERVLRGAVKTIRRCRPILFVEVDHAYSSEADLIDMIESLDYVTDRRLGNVLALPL